MPSRLVFVFTVLVVLVASCSSSPPDAAGTDLGAAGPFRQTAAFGGAGTPALPGLGSSVAVDGALALAGAPGRRDAQDAKGAVYLYRRSGGNWRQDGVVAPPQGADATFGRLVALSGTMAAVADSSAVYLYDLAAGGAAPLTVLSGPGVRSLALAGGTLAVGIVTGREAAPAVKVFERGGSGAWQLAASLTPAGAGLGFTYNFATDIGLSGDGRTLIVANPGDADQYYEDASALVYGRGRGGWGPAAVLAPPTDSGWDGATYGWTVAVDDGVAAVGSLPALGERSSQLFVYELSGAAPNGWREVARWELATPEGDGAEPQYAGRDVAVTGGVVVAGAYGAGCLRGAQDVPCAPGALSVFERSGAGVWARTQKLQPAASYPDQQFARALAFDGQTILAGARIPSEQGAPGVFVFER